MSEPSLSGNEPQSSLVEVELVKSASVHSRQALKTDNEHRAMLGQLLELSVRGAVATQQAWQSGDLYRIVVSPEVQKSLKEGTAEIVKNAKGISGNIVNKETREVIGRARFKPAEMAKLANVATIAWQAAAMVTAQHYLTEINGKLETITGQLNDLANFLEDKERAQLLSALQALKRGSNLLGSGQRLEEHDLRVIEGSVREAFHLAETQIEHRLLAIDRLLKQAPAWDQATQAKTLEQIGQQTQVLAFALTTLTQAFAVGAASGWSAALTDRYRSSGEDALTRVREALSKVSVLPARPVTTLDLDTQPSAPWLLRGLKQIIDEVGYRVDNRRQQRRDRQRTRNEQALDAHVLPSTTQIGDVERMLVGAHEAAALPGETTPLVFLARLDEHGEVVEVFVDVPVAAD